MTEEGEFGYALRTVSGHVYPVDAESMRDLLKKVCNQHPDTFIAVATTPTRYVRQREVEQVFEIRVEDAQTLVGVRSPVFESRAS